MGLNDCSLSEVELLHVLTLNLCGFDPGLEAGSRLPIKSNLVFNLSSAQWCVLPISSPLGVGQAPVENSRGSYNIENVAKKKLV